MSESLQEIFSRHQGSDKLSLHSYIPIYSELLAPYRYSAFDVLEVGVRDGSSLRAWAEYFPYGCIWGVDNGSESGLPSFTDEERDRINLIVADTTKPTEFVDQIANFVGYGGTVFHTIIDDGNHKPLAQAATFAMLSPYLKPGGIYIVEDVEDPLWCEQFVHLFGGEWIDLRPKKDRHDDLLWIWRK